MLCCCNSVYLILLFIQLSISLGNLLLHSKGIVPQIVKCWPLLRASVIGVGTLRVVLFCVRTDHKPLEFFLVSQTLVDNNSDGQPSSQTSFLVSP